jgi:hypothetical protein
MTINYFVQLAIANTLRFTYDGTSSNERASFDQRRYAQTKNAEVDDYKRYLQLFESADTNRPQVYTNFPLRRISIINCDEEVVAGPFSFNLLREYRNKSYLSDCKFASVDGKLFVYFVEGYEYDESFDYPADLVALNGVLPNINAVVGDIVSYDYGAGFTGSTITELRWSPELEAQGYLLDVDSSITEPVDGQIEISYDEKDLALYERELTFDTLPEGEYMARMEFGVTSYTHSFTSEPFDVRARHDNSLALDYYHEGEFDKPDQWNYLYEEGWFNRIRVPADFYEFIVGGEIEADTNDTGEPRILRVVPFRQVKFSAKNIPSWLVDKFMVILSHDRQIKQLDLGSFEVTMKQKGDRTIAAWSFEFEGEVFWEPDSFEDIAFAGAVVSATFHSSLPGVFQFISLPAWITPNVFTFEDGDEVEFTISANGTFFDRSVTLVAYSEEVDDLTAEISFEQLFDDSVPDFIDAEPEDSTIDVEGGFVDITVSASGPWEALIQSGFAFALSMPDANTLRVTAADPNETVDPIMAVVRVRLTGSPGTFDDVNVGQSGVVGLISVTPSGIISSSSGGNNPVDVVATAGTEWQAITVSSWVVVNPVIQVGSVVGFNIFINGRDLDVFAPRFASVTLQNVNVPADTLLINIQQN